ncbi:YdcF family protein [Crenalkalicoccus roseus]|uniref:YdcF family protein n=1 Tax=Crenalkalicoccus roseus TaxID=1485588 RepID=UPI001080628E|nr:YdcF family protein [Crenalkalicoccus roseus]
MSGADPAAIIIFGAAVRPSGLPSGALRRRVEAALAFGEALPGTLYVPTGARGRFGEAESAVMAALLITRGVPRSRILEEPTGTDTLSSAIACARLLRARGHRGPVLAASSAYHLPRCLLLLRLAGLKARPVPPPRGPAAAGWRQRWWWRLREVPALPYDALLMLWHRARRRI